ncbi:MAG TPA: hypothetical protein PKL11_05240 [Anaerolineaceae bacterium]|nr:hypothetical protein [Longilinea sp.]HNZ13041.1 hypothetical protein [Anaerolineaceae bacterium]HOG79979.1 hypothetical protein [Anaerolineaceae bacterium]HQF61940.1 hypothetical protein [Anaerolineaceae bacterium]HQH84877.1 hypothetical protein [Anaerolineaceae bacterium]
MNKSIPTWETGMNLLERLFGMPPYPPEAREEMRRLVDELVRIGIEDDYLSERPGAPFNAQCRHVRAREIGKRLHDLGGLKLMVWTREAVGRKLGRRDALRLLQHLDYAWAEIGEWMP